jgi:hypothetical protein
MTKDWRTYEVRQAYAGHSLAPSRCNVRLYVLYAGHVCCVFSKSSSLNLDLKCSENLSYEGDGGKGDGEGRVAEGASSDSPELGAGEFWKAGLFTRIIDHAEF